MKLANIILGGILILATILRLYHLDTNPPAVYGDEISFSVNAWSILKTGVDEWGVKFPLQFRAFDDYKAPVPVYLLTPFFYFGGMNAFTTRLPVVIISVLTVWVTYFFVKELFSSKLFNVKMDKKQIELMGLVSAALLAISPWHIQLSRGYFEATLALLPLLLGTYFFLKGLTRPLFLYASSLCYSLSLYTYFTPRVILLLWLPFLFFYFRKQLPEKKSIIGAGLLFLFLTLPLVKLAIFDKGGNRFTWFVHERMIQAEDEATREQQTAGGPLLIRKLQHNKYNVLISHIVNDYLEHFSLNFWYLYGDNSLRYFLGKTGMFYLYELPFFIFGLLLLLKKNPRLIGFLLVWLFIVHIPTAIAGRPFAVRSLAMLPVPFIFVAFGIVNLFMLIKLRWPRLVFPLGIVIMTGFVISLGNYLLRYHLDYPRYAATWWGWENKAAIDYARQHESQYDQIILSDYYTGMPLAFVYYTQLNPDIYRAARDHRVYLADKKEFIQFGKYYIGSLSIDEARLKAQVIPAKTLYIGSPFEADGNETLTAPEDGRVLFKIHEQL